MPHKISEEEKRMWSNQMLEVFKKAAADIGIDLQPGDIIVEFREEGAKLKDISDSLDKELNLRRYDSGCELQSHITFDQNKITENDLRRIMKIASEKYGIYLGKFTPEFGKMELRKIEKDV